MAVDVERIVRYLPPSRYTFTRVWQCQGAGVKGSGIAVQGCLYGGQNTEGHLGDAWLFDSESMTWQQTATSDFGGFSDAAKAWHAAAVLKCADVSLSACRSGCIAACGDHRHASLSLQTVALHGPCGIECELKTRYALKAGPVHHVPHHSSGCNA